MLHPHRTRGTAVVFVLIMAVALIGILGLAIDTGITLSSRAQLERSAQQAALGAMSRFLLELDKSIPAGTQPSVFYATAKTNARSQAERILRLNPFLGDSFRLGEVPWSLTEGASATGATSGTIEFGKYYVEAPTSSDVCNGKYPCFVPRFSGATTSDPDSAVRIKVGTAGKPLRPVFGRLLGFGNSAFTTQAVSTKVIQNLAFLVDLSASVVSQGYLRFGVRNDEANTPNKTPCESAPNWFLYQQCRTPASGSNYALQLAIGAGNPGQSPNTYCDDSSCLEMGPGSSYLDFNSAGDFYAAIWDEQCDTREEDAGIPCPIFLSDTTRHAQEDYSLVSVNFLDNVSLNRTRQQEDAQGATFSPVMRAGSFNYFIDRGISCTTANRLFCARPEPLLSILKTSGEALSIVKDRAVPGDRVMFAGFDEYMYRSRITCEDTLGTSPATNCQRSASQSKLVRVQSPDFLNFEAAIGPSAFDSVTGVPINSGSNPPAFISKGLFPRYLNTDGNFALWDTFQEMNSVSTSRLARNLIFLFTDGLFNCRVTGPSIPSLDDAGYFNQRICRGSESGSVTESLAQLSSMIGPNGKSLEQNLIDSKISLSIFMFGPGAHRVVRKSGIAGGGCMTLEESVFSEELDDGYVNPTTATPSATDNPYLDLISGISNPGYYEQNRLYSLVKKTRGKWIPILPRITYTDTSTGLETPFMFAGELEAECAEAASPTVIANFEVTPPGGQPIMVTDASGRLLFDPAGRKAEDQISGALDSVLEAGFVLAE